MPKYKTIHYAKDCKNAKELIGDLIYYCPKISDPDKILPFSFKDTDKIILKWIKNKVTKQLEVIKETHENGIKLLNKDRIISYEELLETHQFMNEMPLGIVIPGKKIGCHSQLNCKYFVKK